MIDEAIRSGARLAKAAEIPGLSDRTIIRWRQEGSKGNLRKGPKTKPSHALTQEEKDLIIKIAVSKDMRDLSPKQIVPKLADQGVYLASESSFYRVFQERDMQKHREPSKPATHNRPRAYQATGPNQVWSWDITYLKSEVKGQFFYLYIFMDIWSRMIISAKVFPEESMGHSSSLFLAACQGHGVDPENLVLHSDNGGPMKGSTMLATPQRLGVVPSFSRPKVSNDNPYSESLFRTFKYRPDYPSKPFTTIEGAQNWVDAFVAWYNNGHLHSAIRFITPIDRHYGKGKAILSKRQRVYEKAHRQKSSRWSTSTRNWEPVDSVYLNPDKQSEMLKAA